MKTLNLKSAITFIIISLMNLSVLASGLEFRLQITQNSDEIDVAQLNQYEPIRIQKLKTEVGCYQDYLTAMNHQYKLEELGFLKVEIVSYFNHISISLEDAFTLQDNRNNQDQKMENGIYMSEEDMDLALKNVQNEDFYYTVQIAINTESEVNNFFDFPKTIDETITSKGYYRYTFSKFYTYNDAKDALAMMKEFNFENAEIIAFDNLDRIPLASAIDKEQRRLEASLAQVYK